MHAHLKLYLLHYLKREHVAYDSIDYRALKMEEEEHASHRINESS